MRLTRIVTCASLVLFTFRLSAFRKVLDVANPTCLVAIEKVNKFFVLHDHGLSSYPLNLVVEATLGMSDTQSLEASRELLATDVLFFRAGKIANRVVGEFRRLLVPSCAFSHASVMHALVLYAVKKYIGLQLFALEVVNKADPSASSRRTANRQQSFRPFGEVCGLQFT